jgi:hypothetical protein
VFVVLRISEYQKMGDKVGYAIVKKEHTIKKIILPKHGVQCRAVCDYRGGHEILKITVALSTIIAAKSSTPTKNPKTQTIREMLDHEEPRITLLWVPSSKGIPGNNKTDQTAKEALDEDISTIERYSPDDLKKWLTEEDCKENENKDGITETTR